MLMVRCVGELQRVVRTHRSAGATVGLVPTMGFLHEGHLSLIRQANCECDVVVVSIFVNPTQFSDPNDLEAYPRDEARDVELASSAGAHIVFAPDPGEVYPEGFCTTVRIHGPITESLEGAVRGPAHFWGVATVVAKLFSMAQPDVAYFGQKDAQQCVVVRRLVADLDLPVRIEICPTIREPDGLAMSSRNVRLGRDERERALALRAGLAAVESAVEAGERAVDELERVGRAAFVPFGVEPEYFAGVDPMTLHPLSTIERSALFVTAAPVGPVRLLDNVVVAVAAGR
ncbi:MAG: pantoate--beta-alanine ligase [Ilumatobacteraceae bacterium]|nr:pantoate--beta-alanine ligase [Ilumatobacteraceae bacterium]